MNKVKDSKLPINKKSQIIEDMKLQNNTKNNIITKKKISIVPTIVGIKELKLPKSLKSKTTLQKRKEEINDIISSHNNTSKLLVKFLSMTDLMNVLNYNHSGKANNKINIFSESKNNDYNGINKKNDSKYYLENINNNNDTLLNNHKYQYNKNKAYMPELHKLSNEDQINQYLEVISEANQNFDNNVNNFINNKLNNINCQENNNINYDLKVIDDNRDNIIGFNGYNITPKKQL